MTMKDDAHAIGPVTRGGLTSDALHRLENDVSVFRNHIKDIQSDLALAEKDKEDLAYQMATADSPGREDRQRLDHLDETIRSMKAEIEETTAAINSARSQIEVEKKNVIEQTIRATLKREHDFIEAMAHERTAILEHRLQRAINKAEREQIESDLENVDAIVRREYKHLLRPQRVMNLSKDMQGHTAAEIEEHGDVMVRGVLVPCAEYNRIRSKVEQEMRQ